MPPIYDLEGGEDDPKRWLVIEHGFGNKTGVYWILNLVSGKYYVGSASRTFRDRRNTHRSSLKRGVHETKHLQAAWNKYGPMAFVFEVLEECPPKACLDREQFWLDVLQAADPRLGYNTARIAGAAMLGKNHDEETRAKIGEASRERWKDLDYVAVMEKRKGQVRTPETCDNISSAKKGKKQTPEHREALRVARENSSKIARSKEFMRTEQGRAMISECSKLSWKDPVIRERRLRGMREAMEKKLLKQPNLFEGIGPCQE